MTTRALAGLPEQFRDHLHPDVRAEVLSWIGDGELDGLLVKLRSHTARKAFFDAWAEAVLARHLRRNSPGCSLRFEVPTPNDRRADFEVQCGDTKFFLHLKRVDSAPRASASDRPPFRRLAVSSRLRMLERIRRPYIVQVRWRDGADDDDMQTLVREAETFITSGHVGDEHRVMGEDGREIGGVRIIAPNPANAPGGEHVIVTIGLPGGFIDLSPRISRLLRRAYEQFMPKAANVIVIASGHEDDVIDFESALLGTHIERWDQYPPRGRRVAHGRDTDGFWHGQRFSESQFAVWMHFDPSKDRFRSRLFVRKAMAGSAPAPSPVDERVRRTLETLFEGDSDG